jgi:Zn-finger nucleic acid-binding protein
LGSLDNLKVVEHFRGGKMSNIWDKREKSLEEEYFRRQQQELVEKLHTKRIEEEKREKSEASAVHCPKCDGTLVELTHEEVRIDRCNKCNGIWLDAGELEQLTGKEESHGWLSRMWKSVAG